jgi:hypothetical protein
MSPWSSAVDAAITTSGAWPRVPPSSRFMRPTTMPASARRRLVRGRISIRRRGWSREIEKVQAQLERQNRRFGATRG